MPRPDWVCSCYTSVPGLLPSCDGCGAPFRPGRPSPQPTAVLVLRVRERTQRLDLKDALDDAADRAPRSVGPAMDRAVAACTVDVSLHGRRLYLGELRFASTQDATLFLDTARDRDLIVPCGRDVMHRRMCYGAQRPLLEKPAFVPPAYRTTAELRAVLEAIDARWARAKEDERAWYHEKLAEVSAATDPASEPAPVPVAAAPTPPNAATNPATNAAPAATGSPTPGPAPSGAAKPAAGGTAATLKAKLEARKKALQEEREAKEREAQLREAAPILTLAERLFALCPRFDRVPVRHDADGLAPRVADEGFAKAAADGAQAAVPYHDLPPGAQRFAATLLEQHLTRDGPQRTSLGFPGYADVLGGAPHEST